MPTEPSPEHLAEIRRRNREVTKLRLTWERQKEIAKEAKSELDDALDGLAAYIAQLDEEYPLFDDDAPSEPSGPAPGVTFHSGDFGKIAEASRSLRKAAK